MSALAVLQEVAANTGSGVMATTTAVTIAASKTNNTLIAIVQVRSNAAPTISSVTDNIGNAWIAVSGSGTAFGSAQGWQEYWICSNPQPGVTTITVTPSISSWVAIDAYEISGNVVLNTVTQATNSTGTAASGTSPTIAGQSLLLGSTGVHSSATTNAANGFTMSTAQVSSATPIASLRTGYQIGLTSATYAWTTTFASGTPLWVATLVSFLPISVPGNLGRYFEVGNLSRSEVAS